MGDILLKTSNLLGKHNMMNGAWLNRLLVRSYRGSRIKKIIASEKASDDSFEFPKKQTKTIENVVPEDKVEDLDKYLDFPSDTGSYVSKLKEEMNTKTTRDQSKKSFRPKVDPRNTSIILFPGQGSQFVGMGKKLLPYPKVEEMYSIAGSILGFNLLEMCLKGPQEELNKTIYSQAAVVVTSLAALEKLKAEKPWVIKNCITAAGYSVGEISALVFSGALSFEDAITLIKVRSKAMQEVSNSVPSGMMSISIGPDTKVKFACYAAQKFCKEELDMPDAVCEVSNYLNPGCKIIAGNSEALEFVHRNALAFKIKKCTYLPVSGAFHSYLMKPAARVVKKAIEKMKINNPVIPVHSNVTSKKFKDAAEVKELISQQIYRPVMWEQALHAIYSRPQDEFFPLTYEVGPGRQLGVMLKKVNKKAFEEYGFVDV